MRPQRGINLCKAAKYRVLNRARIIWSRFARSYRRSRERHVDFVSHYCSKGGRVLRKKWGNSTISDGCFGASKMMMIARWQMPSSVFGWFFLFKTLLALPPSSSSQSISYLNFFSIDGNFHMDVTSSSVRRVTCLLREKSIMRVMKSSIKKFVYDCFKGSLSRRERKMAAGKMKFHSFSFSTQPLRV